MVNSHTALGIAQLIFYIPIVPLAIWLLVRNWAYRPRMAWWPMVPLSLMRLAGAIITIVRQNKPYDIGLIIASIVLLNVGAIPLIIANWGQVRIIILDSWSDERSYKTHMRVMRAVFLGAAALLVAGGSTAQDQPNTAKWLSLAGYIVFAAVLVVVIALELFFLTKRWELIPSSRKVLYGSLLAGPFIVLRCIYGILGVTFGYGNVFAVWSPVFGNVVAFALMALLCEYIAIVIWLYIGFTMPPDRGTKDLSSRNASSEEPRKYFV